MMPRSSSFWRCLRAASSSSRRAPNLRWRPATNSSASGVRTPSRPATARPRTSIPGGASIPAGAAGPRLRRPRLPQSRARGPAPGSDSGAGPGSTIGPGPASASGSGTDSGSGSGSGTGSGSGSPRLGLSDGLRLAGGFDDQERRERAPLGSSRVQARLRLGLGLRLRHRHRPGPASGSGSTATSLRRTVASIRPYGSLVATKISRSLSWPNGERSTSQ